MTRFVALTPDLFVNPKLVTLVNADDDGVTRVSWGAVSVSVPNLMVGEVIDLLEDRP